MRPIHGGNLVWAAEKAGCHPTEILDFSASINPLGPPTNVITAIQANLTQIIHYPDPSYQQLCLALGAEHWVDPSYILPGNGAAELLTWAARELADLEEIVLFTPAFRDYDRAITAFGGKIKKIPLDLSGIPEMSALPSLEQEGKNRGLLINNPHNPTGKLWQREELLPYLDQFALVVIDEAFMDFLPPEEEQSLIPLVKDFPNLVIIRSLTKFYSIPGLRLGYAIAVPQRLQRWQEWRDPWSVNILAEVAGIAALKDQEFRQQTWDWLAPTKKKLFRDLATIPGLEPHLGAANFLLVQSQPSVIQLQAQLLQERKILIRDCLSFPELGDRYFRVAIRTLAENQHLVNGLTSIVNQQHL
jgi:L-threonine-O-3-phosphate decarboxylase